MEQASDQFARTQLGTIEISPEVIEVIAGLAAIEVSGVRAMSGGFVGNLTERLGRKNLRKGVRVDVDGQKVSIAVSVILSYDIVIPEVAQHIQQNIKHAIETMTSLSVEQVNIFVTGVELS